MKEHNADNLRRALNRLPQYDAPAGNWAAIERQLTPPLRDRLPAHQPPATVWNAINAELTAGRAELSDGEHAPAVVRTLPNRRRALRRVLAYAAGLLLLLTAGFGLQDYLAGRAQVSVAYSREPAPSPFTDDSELEESSFARAVAQIEARNEPTLNSLRLELDELTAAKREVKAMLVSYGNDPAVIRQLAEIERDRSDIYRRIIVEL